VVAFPKTNNKGCDEMATKGLESGRFIRRSDLLQLYEVAKKFTLEHGYAAEAEWQRSLTIDEFAERDLLCEAAWVVLCSGFREQVVRDRFDYISLCFFDWSSAEEIVCNAARCTQTALSGFRNTRKIGAIVAIAELIHAEGFDALKTRILRSPIEELRRFPFVGEVTAFHLAKNLGFAYAKPDRHLTRLVRKAQMTSAEVLCRWLAKVTGDAVPYVDLILWRYLASNYSK
jgi:hypothetical protein